MGSYLDSANRTQGLIESLASGNWTAQAVPVSGLSPAPDLFGGARLQAVSCSAPGSCAAVGVYIDQAGQEEGLIATLAGGTWTAQTAPLPPGGQTSWVFNVSCSAPGSCAAVGWYGGQAGPNGPVQGLIETLASGTWTAQAVPVSGLNPAAARSVLHAVSCPAAGSCAASGEYLATSGGWQGLIATLSSGMWTAITAPAASLDPAPAASPAMRLDAIACAVPGACAAVGAYQTGSSQASLIETLASGTWTGQSAPTAGLSPGPGLTAADIEQLTSVTCPAPGSCVAVGQYNDSAGGRDGFAETLAAGSWQATTLPVTGLEPPAQYVETIGDVSCPAAGSCVAVGNYADPQGYEHALIQTLAAGTWTAQTAPATGLNPPVTYPAAPAAAPFDSVIPLSRVACPAVGACVAAGLYTDPALSMHGLIETLGTAAAPQPGYWLAAASGRVYPFRSYRYPTATILSPVVAMTANGPGYLQADQYGRVYSVNGGPVCAPPPAATTVIGIAADHATGGYWLATSTGHVYPCHAPWYGSLAGKTLAAPVTAITADQGGYLLLTATGQVYPFHAPAHGGLTTAPRSAVTGIAADPATGGYWLITRSGNVYAFGAPWYGSLAGKTLTAPVTAITATPAGYLLVTAAGQVYAFHTPSYGTLTGSKLRSPVIAITTAG